MVFSPRLCTPTKKHIIISILIVNNVVMFGRFIHFLGSFKIYVVLRLSR